MEPAFATQRHGALRQHEKEITSRWLGGKPDAGLMLLADLGGGKPFLGLPGPALQLAKRRSGLAVCQARPVDLLATIGIVPGEPPLRSHAVLARSAVPTRGEFLLERAMSPLGPLPLGKLGCAIKPSLFTGNRVAARIDDRFWRLQPYALRAKRIEKRPVVADDHAYAPEPQKGPCQEFPGLVIEMIGGLVDRQEIGLKPERTPDLRTLAFPVAQALPPFGEVRLDVEATAQARGLGAPVLKKLREPRRRRIGSLGAIDRPEPALDMAGRWGKLSSEDPEKGRLASPIWADDAGEPLHQMGGKAAQKRFGRAIIGKRYVAEGDRRDV